MSKMLRLGALVLALSLVLTACGGGFSDEARNEFMAGCEPGAGTEFCECTLDELEKTISEEDLPQIVENAFTSDFEELPEEFVTAIRICVEKTDIDE